MGYRSDVRIATTRDGYDRMCRFVDAASKDRKSYQLMGMRRQPEFYDEHDGCTVFGWDSIKWYEGSLPDVTVVCNALGELDKAEVPYEFCRVGESYDDIEFTSRNDNEALSMHVYPDVTIEIVVG